MKKIIIIVLIAFSQQIINAQSFSEIKDWNALTKIMFNQKTNDLVSKESQNLPKLQISLTKDSKLDEKSEAGLKKIAFENGGRVTATKIVPKGNERVLFLQVENKSGPRILALHLNSTNMAGIYWWRPYWRYNCCDGYCGLSTAIGVAQCKANTPSYSTSVPNCGCAGRCNAVICFYRMQTDLRDLVAVFQIYCTSNADCPSNNCNLTTGTCN